MRKMIVNPNKAGLFESSFFWSGGINLTTPAYFKKNKFNIKIGLYNC